MFWDLFHGIPPALIAHPLLLKETAPYATKTVTHGATFTSDYLSIYPFPQLIPKC